MKISRTITDCDTFLVEFATMTLDETTQQPKAKIYRPAEVDALLEKHGITKSESSTKDTSS